MNADWRWSIPGTPLCSVPTTGCLLWRRFGGASRGAPVHGLGAQFAGFDLSGGFVPIVTREQGVGRGWPPLTMLAEATEGAGGAEFSSYATVPFAMVGTRRGVALDTTRYSTWDMRRPELVDVTHWHHDVDATVYSGDRPAELLALRTSDTGRPDSRAVSHRTAFICVSSPNVEITLSEWLSATYVQLTVHSG